MGKKASVVLVHGAWGDGSHWSKMIPVLHAKGYGVCAVQNPLTSLADDIERTRRLIEAQDGPVLLVGHSYGGAVISGAGHAPKVAGLVYVAAFAPDEGETVRGLLGRHESPAGAKAIRPDQYGFLWLDRGLFKESFCQDLGDDAALIMAAAQKPIAARCFDDKAGPPAWKQRPCWYQASLEDHMVPPETQQWMAQRIGARRTIELAASHASMAAYPHELVALIDEAAAQL
ncbi:alpha/beta hydrolase [Dyella sp. BiH032]|uniref:alpha/beta hydrolase n=1 Tax=Dyella sp. BiH032 TaxID=3075430 RepID=UPI002893455F|nr:alpha/beta hydrolase [Dyella sp. BiH032]WNL45721.1 alpha/beta hydrolase [Dyella sp. BiH032]